MAKTYQVKYWTPSDFCKGANVAGETKNKMNAKTAHYDGRNYRSIFERNYAIYLDWQVRAGLIKNWEYEKIYELKVNGIRVTSYRPDFRIVNNDLSVEVHETKGYETPEFKIKWNLFVALSDELEAGAELIIVKQGRAKYWNNFAKSAKLQWSRKGKSYKKP